MFWGKRHFLILILVVFNYLLKAQLVQDSTRRIQWLALPVLFKSPELGWGYGISGSASFKTSFRKDTLTRTSVVQAIGLYTTRKQNVQAIDALIYFPKEKYVLFFQSSHSYFPDKFWGIGPNTNDRDEERYVFEQFIIKPHLRRRIYKQVFAGILYEYQNVYKITSVKGGIFEASDFYGKQKYQVSGPGLSLSLDTRGNTFWPERSVFLMVQASWLSKDFGSDYDVKKIITDLRFFKRIVKGHVVALQLYNYCTQGQTPLRELAAMGGPNNLRGFYQGRYRGINMNTAILEYRVILYKRLGACLFGGAGNVFDKTNEVTVNNLRYSYGGGLRVALLEKERLNLRLDYGYSNRHNKGFYFTVGECF